MKRLMFCSMVAAFSLVSIAAFADEPRHRYVGVQADTGVPDGAALGLVVKPIPVESFDMLRVGVSGTYNGIAPGVRAGLTIDPLRWHVFAPTLTGEAGHAFTGTVPGGKGTTVSYDYLNAHFGLEFGNRNAWRFFMRGGVSWVNFNTGNFQGALNLSDTSVIVGNPTFNGMFAPSLKLGFYYAF